MKYKWICAKITHKPQIHHYNNENLYLKKKKKKPSQQPYDCFLNKEETMYSHDDLTLVK